MTDQRSVSSMPGVTLTFVLADGPGDGLRMGTKLRAQVPLDGRGPLQGDEVRPRVAARRRDVEVLLPEGPRTGIDNSVVLN